MEKAEHVLDFSEDFGQKVDLTQRIREVLANYPEGTTILKELVQNADDAGATKICFCLDRRQHGRESLASPSLSVLQGPALLAYNDAQFTEEDFESISRIGDSKKQGQRWKTGKFGVGFNSVYHLSDLPSFVSGRHIVFFDPQCKYLPVSSGNPGKKIDFVKSSVLKACRDQFLPYCAFGCDMEKPYPGTLFRFVLRNIEQANISRLSKQSYTIDDMEYLLQELYIEAVLTLLYLKNIEIMEIYDWQIGAQNPSKLYSCCIKTPNSDLRWHRQTFLRLSKSIPFHQEGTYMMQQHSDTYTVDLVNEAHEGHSKGCEGVKRFAIVQMMADSSSRIGALAKNAYKQYGLGLVPWLSVAADISSMNMKDIEQAKAIGRAFCFLPLPQQTGFSFHINGYFELSANRRDIWFGADMDRAGKIRSDWNQCLLEDVGAAALALLLRELSHRLGPCSLFYSLWPEDNVRPPWQCMARKFYANIQSLPILYSAVEDGKWISPRDAVFHDEEYADSNTLAEALLALGMPLIRPPMCVRNMVTNYCISNPQTVTCSNVRTWLRKSNVKMEKLHLQWICTLLEYVLDDLIDEEALKELLGLPLVPLEGKRVGSFGSKNNKDLYFICSGDEYNLLKKAPHKLVERNLPEQLQVRLSNIAKVCTSNVCHLLDVRLGEVLVDVLPNHWKNHDAVNWEPEKNSHHPKLEWLIILWKYIKGHSIDVSEFHEWPLLPTTESFLCRPIKHANLLRSGFPSNNIEFILMKLGCRILRPGIIADHPYLSEYIHDATAAGILDSIFASAAGEISSFGSLFSCVDDSERKELKDFLYDKRWYNGDIMNEHRIKIFKALPIFEAYKEPGSTHSVFTDLLHAEKVLAPIDMDKSLLGPNFLIVHSGREAEVLIGSLGILKLGRAAFYRSRVLSRLTEVSVDIYNKILFQILRELPQLCLEDQSIKETLEHLNFVRTGAGSFKAPAALYDPTNPELCKLLNDGEFFPAVDFASPDILDMLKILGLRTSVLPDTILAIARRIESLVASDADEACRRGCALLSYLDLNSHKWLPPSAESTSVGVGWMLAKASSMFHELNSENNIMLNKFWNELKGICWCPVLMSPPHMNMPWPLANCPVAPPKLVRLQSDMWLASASIRILDGECRSSALCQKLGWSTRLGGHILAAQLLELGKNHATVKDVFLGQVLATTIPTIYALLNAMLGIDEMEIVKAILEGSRWVWVGDGFASVQEVAFTGPLHLAPYLRVIPADLAVFKDLLLELGIRESFSPFDYSLVLHDMAKDKQDAPLDNNQLDAAVWVVQHLADLKFSAAAGNLVVPDSDGILVPHSQLVYNDAPWLATSSCMSRKGLSGDNNSGKVVLMRKGGTKFVHPKISNDVADRLGVCSLRRSLLAESADSMDLTLENGVEAFGQNEALTTRLRNIVEMYADGPGILFELIQNADDAGATEVCILLDKTQHGTSSVLSPRMADWQGPALYCYNNSVFNAHDLYAISRIGQDSKLQKPLAIGRFGLGFNSVYHFTDLPSFVSGPNLVIFDPHASNLPGITPAQPGLKINFVGRGMLDQFPDQFSPFLLFGCNLERPFAGTLFRFPLRTTTTAARSDIKNEAYNPDSVLSLFSFFEHAAEEALLFLRHVETVAIYIREEGFNDMEEVFRVHKTTYETGKRLPDGVLSEFVRGDKKSQVDKQYFYNILQKTTDKEMPWHCSKVQLRRRKENMEKSDTWLVSNVLGGGSAKDIAIAPGNRTKGFVPWAGIAARLLDEGNQEKTFLNSNSHCQDDQEPAFEGRAFCFLPLPVKIGLPVHVNGYFELSSNRRDIWYGGDMIGGGKLRSEWNICLLKDVAAPAYARLLAEAANQMGNSSAFQSLWPTEPVSEPWHSLACQVYSTVVELEFHVLYTPSRGGKWISAKRAVFPDHSFQEASEIGMALMEAGLPLVHVQEGIVRMFRESCPSLKFFSPQWLRKLLIDRKYTFANGKVTHLALKYCLNDIQELAAEKLYGLSLIPLCNGSFGTFASPSSSEKIFVAKGNTYELLKCGIAHMLVDRSIEDEVFYRLESMASNHVCNLSLLTPEALRELLPVFLPPEWEGKKCIPWTPGLHGHPSAAWMELLWRHFEEFCEDLSFFSGWPLLSTSDGCLLQLSKESPIVIRNEGWNEVMVSFFKSTRCFLLGKDFFISDSYINQYVHEASALGLLNLLISVAATNLLAIPTLLGRCSPGEVRELRHYLCQSTWFTSYHMEDRYIELFKNLPMFESCWADSNKKPVFLSLSMAGNCVAPSRVPDALLGRRFICLDSEKEEAVLEKHFNIKKLTKMGFYEEHLISLLLYLPLEARGAAMRHVLEDVGVLLDGTSSFKEPLSQIKFVPTGCGTIEAPGRLYDPRIQELQTLLNNQAFFPSHDFRKDSNLDVLVSLGLKRSLGRDGLLDAAMSVAMASANNEQEAFNKGKALLSQLERYVKNSASSDVIGLRGEQIFPEENKFDGAGLDEPDSSLQDEDAQFWLQLSSVNWCPVHINPPLQLLPWRQGANSAIAPPKMVRPKSQMWLVSGTMRILDAEECSSMLSKNLGWEAPPNVGVLASQLNQIAKEYNQLQSAPGKENTLMELKEILSKQIIDIYNALEYYVASEYVSVMQSMFDGLPCIWVDDRFVLPGEVAFDTTEDFFPYLHKVPPMLEQFKTLFCSLGVRETFGEIDYINVLQRIAKELKGSSLAAKQLDLVLKLIEIIAESLPQEATDINRAILELVYMPDASGYLMSVKELVFNDAPWLSSSLLENKGLLHLVHPDIDNEVARRLGAKSLRYLSVVEQEMTSSLPCVGADQISNLLDKFSCAELLLFDLLEIADLCGSKKVHFIYDKRDHPKQSLLQPNLSDFQGSAFVIVFEGAALSTEDLCAIHAIPPVRARGQVSRYGCGLLAAYRFTNLLCVVSNGRLYLFDPSGKILVASLAGDTSKTPLAKAYSLKGTGLPDRFGDQLEPFHLSHSLSWNSSDATIIRLPLRNSSQGCQVYAEPFGEQEIAKACTMFKRHASASLLSLKSVEEVSLSTWEMNKTIQDDAFLTQIDPARVALRNPFQDKKWRRFHLSKLFGTSNTETKYYTIDTLTKENKTQEIDKWLVVQCLNMGHMREMALDRRLSQHQVAPIVGIAARISSNGLTPQQSGSCILAPLPIPLSVQIPVVILGDFILTFNGCRQLFGGHLNANPRIQGQAHLLAWNKELLDSLSDPYIRLLQELQHPDNFQNFRTDVNISSGLQGCFGESSYSLWPCSNTVSDTISLECYKADSQVLVDSLIRPMYSKLVDLPVWKAHGGRFVRLAEGVFVCSLEEQCQGEDLLENIRSFLRSHYCVFDVPWELGKEAELTGFQIKKLMPKSLRDLLKLSSTAFVTSLVTQIDLLEYCCSDLISGDLSMESSRNPAQVGVADSFSMIAQEEDPVQEFSQDRDISGALSAYDYKRGTIEFRVDRTASTELQGLPCPTANHRIAKIGTVELWFANSEQQSLLPKFLGSFIHPLCNERHILSILFHDKHVQSQMRLREFSPELLAANLHSVLHEQTTITTRGSFPWIFWKNEPSADWLQKFWRHVNPVSAEAISLFSEWPLIPAIASEPLLVQLKQNELVFTPYFYGALESEQLERRELEEKLCAMGFAEIDEQYSWILPLMQKNSIPVFDRRFINCNAVHCCISSGKKPLVHTLIATFIAHQKAGYFAPSSLSINNLECDLLFRFFSTPLASASYSSSDPFFSVEELNLLRSLPIYKTKQGNYVAVDQDNHYFVDPNMLIQPNDEHCLPFLSSESGGVLYQVLGIRELSFEKLLIRYLFPTFNTLAYHEKGHVLAYVCGNWAYLKHKPSVVAALRETKFVEGSASKGQLFLVHDLLDPEHELFSRIFFEEDGKFPGGHFRSPEWLCILRDLGFCSAKDPDLLLECARKIEKLGKTYMEHGNVQSQTMEDIPDDLWTTACMLSETIIANLASLYGSSFCDSLSKIMYVPAERGIPVAFGGHALSRRVLASYGESVLLKDWSLAWTCSPILSKHSTVPPEFAWGSLHLRSPPQISTVIQHLQEIGKNGGEDILARWPNGRGSKSAEDVFGDILKHLSRLWDGLPNSDKKQLQGLYFIPIANGTRLVPASALYLRLETDLAPFLFEVPRTYLAHAEVLTELGMEDTLDFSRIKAFLVQLRHQCGYQRLNPNELRAVLRMLQLMCNFATDKADDAIVPDDGARLVHARSCIYIDVSSGYMVKDIDYSRIRFVHPDVPEQVCLQLGVKKLSQAIYQELDKNTPLEFIDSFGQVSLRSIVDKLSHPLSAKFIQTVIYEFKSSLLSLKHTTEDSLHQFLVLEAHKIRFVRNLQTKFYTVAGHVDVTRYERNNGQQNSGHKSLYFIDNVNNMIFVAEPPSFMRVSDLLAAVISTLLDSTVCLPISILFNELTDPNSNLDLALRVAVNGKSKRNKSIKQDELLGTIICPADISMLQYHPLRAFHAGEIVGWCMDKLTNEQMKYGRIVKDVRAAAGEPLYHVQVETKLGEVHQLLSSNIWAFRNSVNLGSFQKSSSVGSSQQGMSHVVASEENLDNDGQQNCTVQPTDHLQQESTKVPAEDVAKALKDMLASMGMPLKLQEHVLLEQALMLQEKLSAANTALVIEQEKVEATSKEVEATKAAWTCRVCLTTEVNILLTPCGHVLCQRCSIAMSRCPFCRRAVSSSVRMYRP